MTSWSSDSKTLVSVRFSLFFPVACEDLPVEVLGSTNGDDGVGVGQAGEDADPSEC